jgi:hypothetical protein
LKYSIGFNLTDDICAAILALPDEAWQVAYDADGQVRGGAWVAELTGMLDLSAWPKGMRLIVRKERPHPGAQLRFTDVDGHRFTCFVTGTRPGAGHGQLAPTWNYATGSGPAARTVSARARTPACGTYPCTASPPTRSGSSSSLWPWS